MKYNALGCEVGGALVAEFLFCYLSCAAEETFFDFGVEGVIAFHGYFTLAVFCKFITEFLNTFLKFLFGD